MQSKTWLWISLLLVVLVGGAAVWYFVYRPQAAELTSCTTVSVYSDANYGGSAACLAANDYTSAQITAAGITEPISSIIVATGYTATIYTAVNFTGSFQVLTANNYPTLDIQIPGGTGNWDNNIKSLRVAPILACTTVSVYAEPDYGPGERACLAIGDYDLAALTAKKLAGTGNDAISSIKVPSGYTATVYTEDKFTGASEVLTKDYRWLNVPIPTVTPAKNWADNIISLKVASTATPTTSVDISASKKTIESGDAVTLTWTLVGLTASQCTGAPSGWFTATTGTTGTAIVSPTATTTYNLTCGTASDETTVTVGATSACAAPLTETRTQSCPSGQTGSITQTRAKGEAPTCAWGDWTQTTSTCTTTVTTTTTPTTTTTATTTATPASTGPETPLVAGGLLSLSLGAFYWLRRKI